MNNDATIMLEAEIGSPQCDQEIVRGLVRAGADISSISLKGIRDDTTRSYLTGCYNLNKIRKILGVRGI